MCGIAGYTGKGDDRVIKNMIQSIRYRGPDALVTHCDYEVALAHARLSILDIRPEGNQPMFSSDKKLAITFNGEIYNYLEIKKRLSSKFTFATTTDTEVLLYLYKEKGKEMLKEITGMFAFAIYDYEKKELFVAKDRMGKKPLYYTATNNSFVFASELKAILTHPEVERQTNIEAVNQYLTFDYVPTPNTIIKNIFKLEPSHYLIIKENRIVEKKCYWQNEFTINTAISFDDAKKTLDKLLCNSVGSRLMSDVPLGVFLSGGLDSSTVAYYAQKNASHKIKTFSIGFENKSYDEADYAFQVANHLHTDHYCETLTAKHTLELIDEIYPNLDEPFADASLIPTYFLSKVTRQKVTVALGGDGSDEIFAGYPTFISEKFTFPFSHLPNKVIKLFVKLANTFFPPSDKNISFDFKVKQFLRGFLHNKNHVHQLWLGSFLPEEKQKLFKPEIFNSLKDRTGLGFIDYHFGKTNNEWKTLNKIIYYYIQTYLLDDILVKVDRASMYNSLEVRAPFLDTDVVEFINSLPLSFKQKGLTSKYLLKKLMEDKLPKNIIYRPKKGFGIPLSDWIRKDLKSRISEVLLSNDDYFDKKNIEKILSEHVNHKANHRKLIWNLFVLKNYFLCS